MSCHDNVLDLQMKDCELDDGKQTDIGAVDDVCDIPMCKDLARLAIQNRRFRDPRICATDPENWWSLTFGACREEFRIFSSHFLGPFLVAI